MHTFCIFANYPAKTQDGNNTLVYTAGNGHTDCVRMLLEGGADKDAKTSVRDINKGSLRHHECFYVMKHLASFLLVIERFKIALTSFCQ